MRRSVLAIHSLAVLSCCNYFPISPHFPYGHIGSRRGRGGLRMPRQADAEHATTSRMVVQQPSTQLACCVSGQPRSRWQQA
eukprot:12906873-Prorocentrum_lima.AAC.1